MRGPVRRLALGGLIWILPMLACLHAPSASRGGGDGQPRAASKRGDPEGDAPRDEEARVARAAEILGSIGRADREAKLRGWAEIQRLHAGSPAVHRLLLERAAKDAGLDGRYARYVAAATLAGIGMPTRIGPNNLNLGASLSWYVEVQKGTPVHGPRRLRLAPELKDMNVRVEPNAKDDLTNVEVLWAILEKYHLDFRLEPDQTFLIRPQPPVT